MGWPHASFSEATSIAAMSGVHPDKIGPTGSREASY